MDRKRQWIAIGSALICGASSAAWADAPSNADVAAKLNTLEAQVAAQKAEIAELKGQADQKWLNEQRTEEVKGLIRDVLADADTRASLQGSGAVAGNDGKFFIASQDGTFRLNVGGQIQVRYVADLHRTAPPPVANANVVDGHQDGFQMRRIEPSFDGYIGSPKLEYGLIFTSDRDTGNMAMKIAQISYTFGDSGVRAYGGRIYDCFARESIMSSKYQQTVERSTVANVIGGNDDIVEGVGVEWKALPQYLIINATYSDGFNSGTTAAVPGANAGLGTPVGATGGHDFKNGAADAAATARAEVKLAGDWAQKSDVESWSTASDLQAFVGAAVHFEEAKSGDKQANGGFIVTNASGVSFTTKYDQLYQWTVDALIKYKGFGFMGAFYGEHFRGTNITGGANPAAGSTPGIDIYGATAQAGYMIVPDKFELFGRYEWIDPSSKLALDSTAADIRSGGARVNDLNIVTVGMNYFIKKHTAKFTLDTVIVFDNLNGVNLMGTSVAGCGLLPDDPGRKGQVTIRAQFQLLF